MDHVVIKTACVSCVMLNNQLHRRKISSLVKIVIASRNKGKIAEIRHILEDLPIKLITCDQAGFKDELVEVGNSYKENAIAKAKIVGKKTKLIALAEDSGLAVDALSGKPGIFSARYVKGSDKDRISKLLQELKKVPDDKRTAKFITVVAIYYPEIDKIYTFSGESRGRITIQPQGNGGFGYDPIFFSFDIQKTFGQASLAEKNRVSHRAKAILKAKKFIIKKMTLSA